MEVKSREYRHRCKGKFSLGHAVPGNGWDWQRMQTGTWPSCVFASISSNTLHCGIVLDDENYVWEENNGKWGQPRCELKDRGATRNRPMALRMVAESSRVDYTGGHAIP
ncbi:hypothetical protein DFH08DRAFT_814927 [Mycena albidolilacea]|uniref:Uncharacterized protein n=1 Tax=Mycena albidolilacea TaxID=1033008 RepID=A0AAD6ZNY0_9AGAR|nr:hypothetical protein DFH08DRAFT_814927 [Mycena albidolilacea]